MKQIVRYRVLSIPQKLQISLRVIVDDRQAEYISNYDGGKSTSIALFPIISMEIQRPMEKDENGRNIRPPFNPNDSLGMTKFSMPIFMEELHGIREDMKTPELYSYTGKRLELNDTLAAKFRRVFMIGNITVELSTVVITKDDDSRVEGIKMKFNNEQSSVMLTLNEISSLLYNIEHLDIDGLTFALYKAYISQSNARPRQTEFNAQSLKSTVDIIPKDDFT